MLLAFLRLFSEAGDVLFENATASAREDHFQKHARFFHREALA